MHLVCTLAPRFHTCSPNYMRAYVPNNFMRSLCTRTYARAPTLALLMCDQIVHACGVRVRMLSHPHGTTRHVQLTNACVGVIARTHSKTFRMYYVMRMEGNQHVLCTYMCIVLTIALIIAVTSYFPIYGVFPPKYQSFLVRSNMLLNTLPALAVESISSHLHL